ncbi:hypothetical protein ACS0TY_013134 [Phlomoides rotata]
MVYGEVKGEAASSVNRSTFALFMQPDWDEKLIFPEPLNIHGVCPLSSSTTMKTCDTVLANFVLVYAAQEFAK